MNLYGKVYHVFLFSWNSKIKILQVFLYPHIETSKKIVYHKF